MLDRVPLLYAGNELGIAFREVGGAFPPIGAIPLF